MTQTVSFTEDLYSEFKVHWAQECTGAHNRQGQSDPRQKEKLTRITTGIMFYVQSFLVYPLVKQF